MSPLGLNVLTPTFLILCGPDTWSTSGLPLDRAATGDSK